MNIRYVAFLISLTLLSCSATKYTLAMDDHSGDYSRIDTIYADARKPKSCSHKNECVQLSVKDLDDFNNSYEYEKIVVYSGKKKDTLNFNLLKSTLNDSESRIDSIIFKNGKGVTSSSFIYGAGIGLVVFLIAPPLSYLSTINSDEKSLSYSSTLFLSSILVSTFLSVGADYFNKDIILYPVTKSTYRLIVQ